MNWFDRKFYELDNKLKMNRLVAFFIGFSLMILTIFSGVILYTNIFGQLCLLVLCILSSIFITIARFGKH